MIKSFRGKQTERLFNDESTGKFSSISKVARRKLEILNLKGILKTRPHTLLDITLDTNDRNNEMATASDAPTARQKQARGFG